MNGQVCVLRSLRGCHLGRVPLHQPSFLRSSILQLDRRTVLFSFVVQRSQSSEHLYLLSAFPFQTLLLIAGRLSMIALFLHGLSCYRCKACECDSNPLLSLKADDSRRMVITAFAGALPFHLCLQRF